MNILYLSFAFNVGGIERMLVDLTGEMAAQGHNVILAVINRDYDEELLETISPDVRVIRMNRTPGSKTQDFYMRALSKIVRENLIDVVHCQDIDGVLFSSYAKLRTPSLKIVHTVHNSFELPEASAALLFACKGIAGKTIAISDSVAKSVRRYMKREPVVIPNGIDTTRFVPVSSGKAKDGSIRIGCVARLYPEQKGQDLLVRATERLLRDYPSLSCVIAGEIYKGQDSSVKKLRAYVEDRGLSDSISFVGNVSDVPSFLQTLDVFVLPSRTEGFGISLIEALSCGIPCVASDLEGPREILSRPDLGDLFTPGNAGALAEAIGDVLSRLSSFDPAVLHSYVEERYSLDLLAERHLKAYR